MLDTIHHQGLRLALGAFKSSPVSSLYAESGFSSLAHRRDLLSLKYFTKLHRFPSSPALKCSPTVSAVLASSSRYCPPFSFRARALISRLSLPPIHVIPLRPSLFPPWLFPRPSVCPSILPCPKSCTLSVILRSKFLAHLPDHSDAIHIYTDGSKSSSGVGYVVLFPSWSTQRTLPHFASVLSAELSALLLAVQRLLSCCSSSFVIFTDSYSALQLISSCTISHPIVLQIFEALFRLSIRNKRVTFCWVPAHVGIRGNESVDSLARSAATTSSSSSIPLPVADYFPLFHSFLRSEWQRSWAALSLNFLHSIKPFVTPWHNPSHRCRRWETALARLRIGHTRLTHGFLMSRDPPPQCPSCHTRLTVPHFLVSCPQFASARSTAFPHLSLLNRPPTVADILCESPHFSLPRLMQFLTSVSVLHKL